ncbi:hypothetical protein [Microbacterium sp. H1-D42]|uniref:hypothetical protein n=1 Tax=Microbacterium sp. H1-D42 TaxID=2925844 RepID=UPI001F5390D6|nr:hypothetical protein [Microbacterium sp. H1-D42]UNK70846.1 hypothetical protein MNR00_17100 [Microbacterium sp. H1-D42]
MTESARSRLSAPRGALTIALAVLLTLGLLGMHALSGVALPSTAPDTAHSAPHLDPGSATHPDSTTAAHAADAVVSHHAPVHPQSPSDGHPLAVCPADPGGDGTMCLPGPIIPVAVSAEPPATGPARATLTDDAVASPPRDPRRFALSPLELSISRT